MLGDIKPEGGEAVFIGMAIGLALVGKVGPEKPGLIMPGDNVGLPTAGDPQGAVACRCNNPDLGLTTPLVSEKERLKGLSGRESAYAAFESAVRMGVATAIFCAREPCHLTGRESAKRQRILYPIIT